MDAWRHPPETTPLHCVECGMRLFYAGVGRKPRYCSQTCRSRAWEKRRAARDGLIAQEVVERPVEVYKPIDAEQVTQWLSGHPRRLSTVLKLLEWTDEHLEAFRTGLEQSAEGLSLIPTEEKEQLESAMQEAFHLKNKLNHQRHRLRMQQEENAALKQELNRCKSTEAPTPVVKNGALLRSHHCHHCPHLAVRLRPSKLRDTRSLFRRGGVANRFVNGYGVIDGKTLQKTDSFCHNVTRRT